MSRLNKIFFLITIFNFKLISAAETNYFVKKNNGSVKFYALGNPSAIRIDGVGSAPEGKLSIATNEKTTTLKGDFEFDLNTLNTGIDMRDSHMKEKYLETVKFPNSKLSIEPIQISENILKIKSDKNTDFKGILNLHGEVKAIHGTTEIKSMDDQLKVLAKFKVKSSDFKIENPSFAGITMADEVAVEVEFNLLKNKI